MLKRMQMMQALLLITLIATTSSVTLAAGAWHALRLASGPGSRQRLRQAARGRRVAPAAD
jgi:hypothetical protein